MAMRKFPKVCACILAGGESRRMGRPKLLMPFAGSTLLERAVDVAQKSACDCVIVVTGAYHEAMEAKLSLRGIPCICNEDWNSGQASSIRVAVGYAQSCGFDAAIIMAADQPQVAAEDIDALWRAYLAQGGTAYASCVSSHMGNPCLFDKACFKDLLSLQGDEGARAIFRSGGAGFPHRVHFGNPHLLDDVDTPEEFERQERLVLQKHVDAHVSSTPLDRAQYPILSRRVGRNGEWPLAYLDSAATALTSERVLGAASDFLRASCANIHRGAHCLAEEATDAYESSREVVADFMGVGDSDRLVFTHGATESLNLVAQGWAGRALRAGDVVAIAEDNHHANIVGWQMAAQKAGFEIAWIPINQQGLLDDAAWHEILGHKPAAVALSAQSNVLGYRQPRLDAMIADAKDAGCLVILDAAQSISHANVFFDASGVDFCAVSGHKMGAFTGVGALACSSRGIELLDPLVGGGGMVERVHRDGYRPSSAPDAFEAGTPPIVAAVSWAEAVRQMEEAGVSAISRHVKEISAFVQGAFFRMPGVSVLGSDEVARESLLSFTVDGIHPHDVSAALDSRGIAVRAGHHCAQPLHRALGVAASVRASFGGYITWEEAQALVKAVSELADEGLSAFAR